MLATPAAVAAAVAEAHRREWAYVLAATVRVTRDLDLAEECVQDAYARALSTWGDRGIPSNPAAWLTTVARRRALDQLRRDTVWRRSIPLLVEDEAAPEAVSPRDLLAEIPDDRLRLICTCCHPALSRDAQVALTLRLLCGLSTVEVAHAFLVSESTMAARITRAKKKITGARIPYRVPTVAEMPARMEAMLEVLNLVFTTGHSAPAGADLVRPDLVRYAIDLARMLHVLQPADREVAGLLALFLLTDARHAARLDAAGELILLADQDRRKWDRVAIAEGLALLPRALTGGPPGRFALHAAIAAVHAHADTSPDTDWAEIVGLYDLLLRRWPSPVVALNRAAAIGLGFGPQAGLNALATLAAEPQLASYPYLAAARADFLRRLGRADEARVAYNEAILLTDNDVQRAFLSRQLDAL